MFRKLVLVLSIAVLAFVGYVAMQPAAYEVERSVRIEAPAEVVFAHIGDFNRWQAWNPWQKAEPTQQITITGTPLTAGHSQSWKGETNGSGTMTIAQVRADRQVDIALRFDEPMAGEASTTLAITPQGGGVMLTWAMAGEHDFLGKMFDVLMDMEAMIGASYEQGLADLKQVAERDAGTK